MKLKPFDLEAAKAGAPVIQATGFPARIVCYDFKHRNYSEPRLIVAIEISDTHEEAFTYSKEGKADPCCSKYAQDLFMAPVIKTKFVTVSRIGKKIVLGSKLFDTQEDVDKYGKYLTEYRVGIAKVEWEE